MPDERTLSVERATRLDQALVAIWPTLDRRRIRSLVTGGNIEVNGEKALTVGQRLEIGDVVKVQSLVALPASAAVSPSGLALPVVYEDDVVLVVDKPAGTAVRQTRRSARFGMPSAMVPQLLEERYPQSAHVGGVGRAGVVTTLDDDESGLILVARDEMTYRELKRSVKRQRVVETYTALVEGNVRGEFTIDQPIGNAKRARERLTVSRAGRPARTYVRGQQHLKEDDRDYTVVLVRPLTSRLHQIRLHLAWYGFPIVGDRVYGTKRQAVLPDRIFLHLSEMRFPHPVTHEEVRVESMLPQELFSLLTYMRRPK